MVKNIAWTVMDILLKLLEKRKYIYKERVCNHSVNILFFFIFWSKDPRWGGSSFGDLGNVEYPSLLLLPGPLWPGVVASERVLSMSQIEQTMYKQITDVKF